MSEKIDEEKVVNVYPLCGYCLKPITTNDFVVGHRSILPEEKCSYTYHKDCLEASKSAV